ncbi:MAG: prolyl oligopeptidase family serine peptidase [Phycisphaera sp.]|nr:prolyl oligopeptidase family serine peptidase [Phycisphaera sp.]
MPTARAADEAPKFQPDTQRGDAMLGEYFRVETAKLESACLDDAALKTWKRQRDTYRKQLLEMLGLDPLPERTPLHATITGKLDHEQFTVEKLHFQSRPGLYVTANLYLPKGLDKPAPAILYVCGHSQQKDGDISYGNKTGYQHHGEWFARNGYVCLTIDTLQLGEIQGIHHGTYREGRWWWNARGYTPAGVEAWNSMRAIDYLQSRPEVDGERIGMTGRSGGGSYTWWTSAIDERIKVAVPVAGMTDMRNQVVGGFPWQYADGCVEGHCDCMFDVNTYRWDFPQVAAMIAPRPLLIENSDKDSIFPIDGVMRLYTKVRSVYELYGARDKLGIQIAEGPHKDTQRLRVGAFEWFERHLKGNKDATITPPAEKLFDRKDLRVFGDTLPADELNTTIDETFTAKAPEPKVPRDAAEWATMRDAWMKDLREKCFRGWPTEEEPLDLKQAFDVTKDGVRFRAYDFTSQGPVRLRLYVAHGAQVDKPELMVLNAMDDTDWRDLLATMRGAFAEQLSGETLPDADGDAWAEAKRMFTGTKWAMAYVAPRGVGSTAWNWSGKKRTQIRRRFMLLGQTFDGMQAYDIRRAAATLRSVDGLAGVPLWMQGERAMAGNVLYASLFTDGVTRLDLWHMPASHRDGPTYLNVMRYMDCPAALALAAERCNVRLYADDAATHAWDYPLNVAKAMKWDGKRVEIRAVPQDTK